MKSWIFLVLFLIGLLDMPAWAQSPENMISRIQLSMPSIVQVNAMGVAVIPGPEETFIDSNTGLLVQAQGTKVAQFSNQGAGVVIDPRGIIVTNAHVVEYADKIAVTFADQKTVGAYPLRLVLGTDLAFLQITPPYPLTRVEIADSFDVRLGDEVVTVGTSPFLQETISAGRLTGIGQSLHALPFAGPELFQININIYHGDSGGPLFNTRGQLLGLMVARQSEVDRTAFAIPSSQILENYLDLLKTLSEKK